MSQATQKTIKDYYRKTGGYMSLMAAMFMLAVASISMYAAENFIVMVKGAVESENNVISIYYFLVFAGLITAVATVIFAVAGMRGSSDDNFRNQSVMAKICAVLNAIYLADTIVMFMTEDYSVPAAFDKSIFIIGMATAAAGLVYNVFVIKMMKTARGYCDDGKKKKGSVMPQLEEECLDNRRIAALMSGIAVISSCIWLLCWYFDRQIRIYDEIMADDNALDSMIFRLIAVIGALSVIYFVIVIVLLLKNKKVKVVAKQSIIANVTVMVIFVVMTVIKMGAHYVKMGYPALEYIIFAYVLVLFCAVTGAFTYNHMNKQ